MPPNEKVLNCLSILTILMCYVLWQLFQYLRYLMSYFFQVQITLSTHDVGGLSPRDITLAKFMDSAAK